MCVCVFLMSEVPLYIKWDRLLHVAKANMRYASSSSSLLALQVLEGSGALR